jgi:hypothetical protein
MAKVEIEGRGAGLRRWQPWFWLVSGLAMAAIATTTNAIAAIYFAAAPSYDCCLVLAASPTPMPTRAAIYSPLAARENRQRRSRPSQQLHHHLGTRESKLSRDRILSVVVCERNGERVARESSIIIISTSQQSTNNISFDLDLDTPSLSHITFDEQQPHCYTTKSSQLYYLL